MSLIDDILQGLPLNSLLREQMIQLRAEVAKLETENAILRDDLSEANAQIANYKKQTEELPRLDQMEINILVHIAQHSYAYSQILSDALNIPPARTEYHLGRLREQKYIRSRQSSITEPIHHELTQKGLAYVNENGLI